MLEKENQKHIRLENLLRMLSESSFIESSIFDLESGFSIVESGFLKRESEHESGFFPSPYFLRDRVRVRSGFRSMPEQEPSICVGGVEIKKVNVAKSLGLMIDDTLSWSAQIDKITKKLTRV